MTPMAAMAFALLAVHVPLVLADAAYLAVSERGAERVAVRQLSTALREVVRTLVADAEEEPTSRSWPSVAACGGGHARPLDASSTRPMGEHLLGVLLLDLPPPSC